MAVVGALRQPVSWDDACLQSETADSTTSVAEKTALLYSRFVESWPIISTAQSSLTKSERNASALAVPAAAAVGLVVEAGIRAAGWIIPAFVRGQVSGTVSAFALASARYPMTNLCVNRLG